MTTTHPTKGRAMRTFHLAAMLAGALIAAAPAAAQHGHGHGHAAPANPQAPYAGMQARAIKALSEDDVQRLRGGHGMSLALAAELNGYAGPLHVLEHADALALDARQRAQTEALLAEHKARARALGASVVEAESSLDRGFAGGRITAEDVARQTQEIARLQGLLRAEHLQTHLRQHALLTPEQRARYRQLRGYTDTASHREGHHR
jgi:Spy/CpxP family protein refolding chaperone